MISIIGQWSNVKSTHTANKSKWNLATNETTKTSDKILRSAKFLEQVNEQLLWCDALKFFLSKRGAWNAHTLSPSLSHSPHTSYRHYTFISFPRVRVAFMYSGDVNVTKTETATTTLVRCSARTVTVVARVEIDCWRHPWERDEPPRVVCVYVCVWPWAERRRHFWQRSYATVC